jgi:hypothetical protein
MPGPVNLAVSKAAVDEGITVSCAFKLPTMHNNAIAQTVVNFC